MNTITAKITGVTRVGQSDIISIQVLFSDGSNKEYQVVTYDEDSIRALIKADVDAYNSLEQKVVDLQTLIGEEIN